MMINSVSPCI